MICSGDFVPPEAISHTIEEKYGYSLPLEEGVERFLCDHDLTEGVELLVDSRRSIVKMAQEFDNSCPNNASMATSIRRLLLGLGLPLPPDLGRPLGAMSVKQQLIAMRQEIDEIAQSGHLDHHHLRSFPLDGWSYVEHLLRSTIGFYESLLIGFDEPVERAFRHAREQNSVRPVLQAMRGIENQFPSTKDDLSKQCLRLIGRPSPFAGFRFDDYDNDTVVQVCRNFYAHKLREAVENQGVIPVRESLNITIQLVDELASKNIAPGVVFVTARGRDEYERELLWFVTERYCIPHSKRRRAHELRMFKRHAEAFDLLKAYFTTSPIEDGMFDPPMIPLIQIGGMPHHETA